MFKVICDKCKKEIGREYCEAVLNLYPRLIENTQSYRLTFCAKCMNELEAKMKNEGYDRV